MRWLMAWLATGLTFVGLDMIWLTQAMGFYREQIGAVIQDPPRLGAAVLFYLVYVFGVVVFAVAPALARRRWVSAAWRGGLFGLVAYGTYDLTNLATLKAFTPSLAAIDLAWGFVATGVAASVGYGVTHAMSGGGPAMKSSVAKD